MERLLQWMLARLGWPQYFDIKDDFGDVYLRRYFLVGSSSSGSTGSVGSLFPKWSRAIYLHVMYRQDRDRCHHDHPWPFLTIVLWGGYDEEVTVHETLFTPGEKYTRRNRPGTVRYNRATHTHRVSNLPKGRCYTLVFRGRKARTWGFWSGMGQWIRWNVFTKGLHPTSKVLWCEDAYVVTPEDEERAKADG